MNRSNIVLNNVIVPFLFFGIGAMLVCMAYDRSEGTKIGAVAQWIVVRWLSVAVFMAVPAAGMVVARWLINFGQK